MRVHVGYAEEHEQGNSEQVQAEDAFRPSIPSIFSSSLCCPKILWSDWPPEDCRLSMFPVGSVGNFGRFRFEESVILRLQVITTGFPPNPEFLNVGELKIDQEKSGNFNCFLHYVHDFANRSMEIINLSNSSTTFDFFSRRKVWELVNFGHGNPGKWTIQVQWEPCYHDICAC